MNKLFLAATLALLAGPVSAKWIEVETAVDHYQISFGEKIARVGSGVVFWSKENYVLVDGIKSEDLDFGSRLARYMADCRTGDYSLLFEATYTSLTAKGKPVKSSEEPTDSVTAEFGSIEYAVIEKACGYQQERKQMVETMLVSDLVVTGPVIGQCFANEQDEKREIY